MKQNTGGAEITNEAKGAIYKQLRRYIQLNEELTLTISA
jgi:hypothetical protein